MRLSGFIRVLCFVALAISGLALNVERATAAPQVEIKNSPYNFAISNYSLKDKKTSSIGFVVSDVNDSLNELRGKKGVILFILSLGFSALCLIFKMKPAGVTFGLFAGLIMLINRPMLFFFIAIPVYIIRLRAMDENNDRSHIFGIFAAAFSRKSDGKDTPDKENREYMDKLTNDSAFDKGKAATVPSKLSRPI